MLMEPYFEICFTPTYSMVKENNAKTSFLRIPVLILTAATALYNTVFAMVNGVLDRVVLHIMVLWVLFIVFLFLPHLTTCLAMRNVKKLNDGVMPEGVLSFGDTIHYHEGVADLTLQYRQVVRAKHLKHSYKLWFGKRTAIIFDPNGFTKGTFEEFKQFMREKCPNVTFPE